MKFRCDDFLSRKKALPLALNELFKLDRIVQAFDAIIASMILSW